LILRMLSHAERVFADIQASPTASSSVVPEAIIQYMRRTMIGMTKHVHASIKVLESTSKQRKLSANQAATFLPMLEPDHTRDITAITISSGSPGDEGLKLPENKRSPCRMVSAPTLGQHPSVKVNPASYLTRMANSNISAGESCSMYLDRQYPATRTLNVVPQAPWRFARQPQADTIPGPESVDSASVEYADEPAGSGPDEPVPPPESSPPAQQPVTKRARRNSKSK
jgi:hypothetical protein